MEKPAENLVQFLARYSIYGILPGIWFAYIGGIAPWYGAAGGFLATVLIAIPVRLVARAERLARSRKPIPPWEV